MAEEAIQNLQQNWTQTYIAFLSPPFWKKQMYPVMQNVPYLKHVALERRPIALVPSPENKCPFQGRYGISFQFQVDETSKGSWISHSVTDIERNASFKNEGNLEGSFDIVIFAGKPANRLERQEKEVRKKRGMKKSISGRKMPYDDSSWDTSLFCIRSIRYWYCHHLHMNEEAIQNL